MIVDEEINTLSNNTPNMYPTGKRNHNYNGSNLVAH
jgi:hypothetical protein